MNKKIVYIFVFLALTIFLTACANQDAVGRRLSTSDGLVNEIPREGNRGDGDEDEREMEIRANSCNADGNCEMDSATIHTLFLHGKTISTNEGSNLVLDAGEGRNSVMIGDLFFKGKTIGTGEGHNLILSPGNGENEIMINGLEGEGNAYLCINENGGIFRSNDPCR